MIECPPLHQMPRANTLRISPFCVPLTKAVPGQVLTATRVGSVRPSQIASWLIEVGVTRSWRASPPPPIHFLPGQFPENDENYPLPKLYMKLVNYWCWELNPRLLSCQASALTIMPLPLQLHKYAFMQMHVSFTQGVHKLSQVLTTEASQCCTQCKFRAVSVDFASMPRPTEQRCAWGIHIFCSLCSHSIWTSVSSNYAFRLSSAFFFPFPFSILNLSKDYSHIASYS